MAGNWISLCTARQTHGNIPNPALTERTSLTGSAADALGLKPRDRSPTASGTPTVQVMVETCLVGRHELGVKLGYLTGNPADSSNKGLLCRAGRERRKERPLGAAGIGIDTLTKVLAA